MTNLYMFLVFIMNPKNMNVSEQLSAQLMSKVGPAWQSHSHIRMWKRCLSGSANRVLWGVASLGCGPWLLGPINQWLWRWAQLLRIRWGHCWCFPPKAKALLPTTCGTQRHHCVGRGALTGGSANHCTLIHNENFKLVYISQFLSKSDDFFSYFLENVHLANGFHFVKYL